MALQHSMFFARLKASLPGRSRSLLTAALRILPADVVNAAAKAASDNSELLEVIAKQKFLNRKKFLELVAAELGIQGQAQLEIPSQHLVIQTGETAESFAAIHSVPQPAYDAKHDFAIVAADPDVPEVRRFRSQGVTIRLGLRADIDAIWEKYRILESSLRSPAPTLTSLPSSLQFVFSKLVADCRQLGAFEVFVGHPEATKYECFADNRIYSGNIHIDVFEKTLEELKRCGRISFTPEDAAITAIHLSPTRSFDHAIICVTWDELNKIQSQATAEFRNEYFVTPPEPPSPPPTQNNPDVPETGVTGTIITRPREVPNQKPTVVVDESQLLLIDDDERFGFLLSTILTSKGYKVTRCLNGQAALSMIRSLEVRPAVIVCDVHMPLVDGPTFIKTLRSEGYHQPVLVLTSEEDRLVEAELALLGADAYVQKREDPRVLIAWIKNLAMRSARPQMGLA